MMSQLLPGLTVEHAGRCLNAYRTLQSLTKAELKDRFCDDEVCVPVEGSCFGGYRVFVGSNGLVGRMLRGRFLEVGSLGHLDSKAEAF